jgi:Ca2+-binding EF-hand superfamily protein
MFMGGIMGLCKICNLPTPSSIGIQDFTLQVFKEVDQDDGGTVDYEEFEVWIKNSDQIQDFFLKHTGVQTIERAKRRFNDEMEEIMSIFNKCSANIYGTRYSQIPTLIKAMHHKLHMHDKQIIEKLQLLMDHEGMNMINEREFREVMRPWAAFSASDINNDNSLDINELGKLFWVLDDIKPA